MVDVIIRNLSPDDSPAAVSAVYEASWKVGYRGILPDEYLDSIQPGKWNFVSENTAWRNLLALDGNRIVGASSFAAARLENMAGWGEIISFYLHPEYFGRGVSGPLMQAVLKELFTMGFRDIYLWVLEENHRARRFYERFGFRPSGEALDAVIGGKAVRELQYICHIEEPTP